MSEPFFLGAEGAAYMLNSLEYAQQVWLNTGQPRRLNQQVSALAYDQTIKYEGGNFTPHEAFLSGKPLLKRLRTATTIYTTYFEGDTFWPVYVGGVQMPGPNEPIAVDQQLVMAMSMCIYSSSVCSHQNPLFLDWIRCCPSPVDSWSPPSGMRRCKAKNTSKAVSKSGKVTAVLDEGGSQSRLQRVPVPHVYLAHRTHGIKALDHENRDANRPQFADEVGEEVEHASAGRQLEFFGGLLDVGLVLEEDVKRTGAASSSTCSTDSTRGSAPSRSTRRPRRAS